MSIKLAFAIAIMTPSDILLFDEVLVSGDKNLQEKCFDKIEELKKEGRTILVVSHNEDIIKRTCEKSIWLSEGMIKEIGDSEEVLEHYMISRDSN